MIREIIWFCKALGRLASRRGWGIWLLASFLSLPQISWSQAAKVPQGPPPYTLADSLVRAHSGQTELNIFYVHGMGADASHWKTSPQEFEVSQEFRTSLCHLLPCTTKMGEAEGRRAYASGADFGQDAPPLAYFGDRIWRSTPDWRAAAPFVDHYRLVLRKRDKRGEDSRTTTIYVHEINWWPLVFSAKCRQIVAKEASLVGHDEKYFRMCSAPPVPDGNNFRSYTWITNADEFKAPWQGPTAAVINRGLKHGLLDWGFTDALLAVGPLRRYLIEGIRELILDCFDPSKNQEFVVVSHSLGSYLMFSALDVRNDPEGLKAFQGRESQFDTVLSETSHAYFMANQIALLELANLDDTRNGNLMVHLRTWKQARHDAQLVAWSDPDDLLTWLVPDPRDPTAADVIPNNLPAMNATRWFWLLANPLKAHVNYDKNKHVLRAIVPNSAANSRSGRGTE